MCSRSFSWQVTAEGSMPVPDVVGISIGSITRALSARAAHGAVVTNPAAGSGLSLRLHAERLPPERYLQGAREVAPEYDGEVSEERGARSGDIKDDGLHGSPSLGDAHYPRRPRGAPRGRGSARHGFGSAARTHLGGGRLCPFDREAVSRDGDPAPRGSQYGKPRARSWFLRISRAARKRWAVAQRPVGTRHSIASRSESAFVTWLGANQSLRAPIRGGAITRLPRFARNSTVAQNIARMRHGARLLSSPKPGPM